MADNNREQEIGNKEQNRYRIQGTRYKFETPFHPSSFILHPSGRSGFTLLEVLVALVIFGIITLALSGAMTAGLRGRVLAEQRQEDSETVRGLFSTLGRDLQSAYGSMYDPNSLFMTAGSGGGMGQSSSSGALLTLSTQSHRITTTDSGVDPTVDPGQSGAGSSPFSSAQNGSNDPPQQSVALVRYDLNPQAGTLSRHEQLVPNAQTIQQATPNPQDIVANNIVSLKIQLWDPNTQAWRDSWDFEQPNLPAPDTAATTLGFPAPATSTGSAAGTSGAAGASSAASTNTNLPSASSTGTGDVGLPSAVQITLTIRKANGTPGTYTTILPIASPRIQDYPYQGGMSTDPNAPPAATSGGTGGTTGGTTGSGG